MFWSSLSRSKPCGECLPTCCPDPLHAGSTCSSSCWKRGARGSNVPSPLLTKTTELCLESPSSTFWKLPLGRKLGALEACFLSLLHCVLPSVSKELFDILCSVLWPCKSGASRTTFTSSQEKEGWQGTLFSLYALLLVVYNNCVSVL